MSVLNGFFIPPLALLLHLLSKHCCVVAPWLDQQRFLYDPLLDNMLYHFNNPKRCSPRANLCNCVMWPDEQALLRVAPSCGGGRWEVRAPQCDAHCSSGSSCVRTVRRSSGIFATVERRGVSERVMMEWVGWGGLE